MAKKSGKKERKKQQERKEDDKISIKEGKKTEEKQIVIEVDHKKEVIKTFLPLLLGILAGIVSFYITGDMRSRDPAGIIILTVFVYLNKFILPKFEIEPQGKDWAGLGFITFTTWYITWTLLLNL
jgi:F0F1-type ATP synthase assembly protein I